MRNGGGPYIYSATVAWFCSALDTCPTSVSVLKAAVLSNCVHRAERRLSSYSGSLEHFALGRYAIQQILPGLGERCDPIFKELGRNGACVNAGLGELCQFLA
uniref:Uncharacterized protein n=1 Tax=mine drainage metagenome TaxID=410659 RepID=E6PY47_9ZZZZ